MSRRSILVKKAGPFQHGVIPGSSKQRTRDISSPGTYEAGLMWPRNDGERHGYYVGTWTCRNKTSICVVDTVGIGQLGRASRYDPEAYQVLRAVKARARYVSASDRTDIHVALD